MDDNNSFFKRIEENRRDLTKKQAQLAEYILNNYKTAAFLSSVPMGKKAGVSEATVIRLSRALGYEGFIDMMKDIQEYVKNEITTVDKLENMGKIYRNKTILDEVAYNNQMIIKTLRKNISQNKVTEAVKKMSNCNRIIIMGLEGSSGVAEYLGYNLVRIAPHVDVINENHNNLVNIVKNCDENTFVIIMSFPRYSKRIIKLAGLLKKSNANILSITDSVMSPVAKLSDYIFQIPKYDSYSSSLDVSVGTMTLAQVIIMEYGTQNYEIAKKNLEAIEEFNKNFDVFM